MKKNRDWVLVVSIILCIISCGSLIFVFNGGNKNKSNDDTQVEQIVDWSNFTISCLGDSLTFGTGIENSYPQLLKRELGAKMVYNYGIGYSTCSVINECECHPDYPGRHYPMCERYTEIKEAILLL